MKCNSLAILAFVAIQAILVCGSSATHAESICRSLLDYMARENLLTHRKGRVEKISRFIINEATGTHQRNQKSNGAASFVSHPGYGDKWRGLARYFPLFAPHNSDQSLHIATSDIIFGLELPEANSTSPWSYLRGSERAHLAHLLAVRISRQSYDFNLRDETSPVLLNLTYLFSVDRPYVLRPLAFYGRSEFDDSCLGICRLANPALLGILGEIGLPANEGWLEVGYEEDGRRAHLWMNIRFEGHDSEIFSLDATPNGGASHPLLQTSNGETILGDSSTPIRASFSRWGHSIRFLEPVPWNSRPAEWDLYEP